MASSKRRQAKQARQIGLDRAYHKALQANPGNNAGRRPAVPITPKKRGPRPKDGDVTITTVDGTATTVPAYNPRAVAKIRREGDRLAEQHPDIVKTRDRRKRHNAAREEQRQKRQTFRGKARR